MADNLFRQQAKGSLEKNTGQQDELRSIRAIVPQFNPVIRQKVTKGNQRQRLRRNLFWAASGCLLILTCAFLTSAGALTFLYFNTSDGEAAAESGVIQELPTAPAGRVVDAAATGEPGTLPPPAAALSTLPGEEGLSSANTPTPTAVPTPTAILQSTAPPTSKLALNPPQVVDQQEVPARAADDLRTLYQLQFPEYDYFQVAETLGGFDVGPRLFQRPPFETGDRQVFNTDSGNVEATLLATTAHTYFWVDDALDVQEEDVSAAAQRLEEEFYPRLNHLFDQPWTPGVDGDQRFSILHLAGNGDEFELGYFSDQDEYPRALFRDSNEQEIVYLNMGQLEIGSDLYFGTLIHELQHLFQWNLDKNEATWLNEGISQLAEQYAGLATAAPEAYLDYPDTRLDRWEYDDDVIDAHYAASYLFTVYLWEQLGTEGVYELVRHPANGLAAVAMVLEGFQPNRSLEQFIGEWAAANFLDDPAYGTQFAYENLDLRRPSLQTRVRQLPFSDFLELEQLAVHYIDLDASGLLQLSFAGDTTAKLIDAPPTSGEQMWYAPPANDTHAQLTAAFDLTGVERATLEFDTWYNLETDYDFAYLSVSDDGGASWRLLTPDVWASGDYGPGFSGSSAAVTDSDNGWIHERIPLDEFAGRQILLRFHVLTDFETVGRGFALDNIAIPEIGYLSDVETVDQRWLAEGFLRTGWLLPQRWSVQVVNNNAPGEIIELPLDRLNQAQVTVDLGEEGGTLIVLPLTPFTDETAGYWIEATSP